MIPSITDLYYFQAVADELHFSHAAKRLNVTQPSLSVAIKRLETTLNLTLFLRHNKGVTLTHAGTELYSVLKVMLTQWENAIASVNATNQDIQGVVKIGCHSTLIPYMSEMVSMLFEKYPALEIHFHHDLTPKLLEAVVQGHCDIAILTNPNPHPGIILQQIADSKFGCWVSKQHADKFDLYAEDTIFICHPDLPQTQYLIKEILKKTKHTHLKKNTMNQIETLIHMTISGYGIGLLPSNYTRDFFGDKLILVPDAPSYKAPLCLAYRPENKEVKSIQIVMNAIRKVAKKGSDKES